MPEIFGDAARSGAAAEEFLSLLETLCLGLTVTPYASSQGTLKAATHYEVGFIVSIY